MDRYGEHTEDVLFDPTPAEEEESQYERWMKRAKLLRKLRGDDVTDEFSEAA